jgi:hypothetical protein
MPRPRDRQGPLGLRLPTSRILATTLHPEPLRNPQLQLFQQISKTPSPSHLRSVTPPCLILLTYSIFCTAHWHSGAILVSGARAAHPKHSPQQADYPSTPSKAAVDVDDFTFEASQHRLLQRHRRRSQTSCDGPPKGQRWAGGVLLGRRRRHCIVSIELCKLLQGTARRPISVINRQNVCGVPSARPVR